MGDAPSPHPPTMPKLPVTMRAWQYTTITTSLPKSIKLNTSAALPTPKPTQHLVKIAYCSLNPIDYKPAENALARRFMVPTTGSPGIDFAGTIVQPAHGSNLKPGDQVFGCGPNPFSGGCLAEYAVTPSEATVKIPTGLSMEHASTIGVAGLTAWQSILPHKPEAVLINGGSGGVGVYGIQIAKAMGVKRVTAVCSSRNVELCRELGADEVLDYTKGDVVEMLGKSGMKFDHVVDNVFAEPRLFYQAHKYTSEGAKYIVVAGAPEVSFAVNMARMKFAPSWLGGGRRKAVGIFAEPSLEQMGSIADLMVQGKVKAVVDQRFAFDDVSSALERMKSGRARGKIVVEVCKES